MENTQNNSIGKGATATGAMYPEFSTAVNVADAALENINIARWKFHELQAFIGSRMSPEQGRYMAIVKTKLEEACLFAVKGLALSGQQSTEI